MYLKNLHNLKDFCHNDEETGSMAIFHSSQISFKEHQADTVKEKKKKKKTMTLEKSEKQVCCFFKTYF